MGIIRFKVITQAASTVGSVKENVTIQAGKDVNLKASDLAAKKDIAITGKNVSLTSKDNVYHSAETHEYKRTGLSVSLGGGALTVVNAAKTYVDRAAQVRDNQLKTLYGIQTHQTIVKNKEILQDIKGKGMPSISVGLGSSSYVSNSMTKTTEAIGSTVTAGNDVNITTKKDIQIQGSDVAGKNVTLKAGDNIKITAATQTSTNTTDQNSKSGSVGVTFSPTGNGIYANASKGNGHENENIITHRGSTVAAGSMLTMENGKDTDMIGSKAGGNQVTVKTGGNLHIESQQDRDIYRGKTTNKGMGIGASTSGQAAGSVGLSGGNTKGDTHSNYESVNNQAGIYAGKEGFDITVKGNTDLKGAVIDSSVPAEKNQLTTGTLTWEDMENKADYKAGNSGTSYHMGNAGGKMSGGMTPVSTQDVKDKAFSTTKTAIAEGTVTITNEKNQKQDIGALNRDTKDSLNKLAQIFDKEDEKERQELVNQFSQIVNEKIGDIAAEKGWAPNDPRRTALHALAGGLTSRMGGGSATAGAAGAGVMESLQPVLDQFVKEHPDMREEAAVLIGGVVGKLTGDTNAGEAAAWSSTKFNWLSHEEVEYYNEKIKNAKSEKEREYYQNKMNVQDIAADRMIKEYVKKHPESADALTETFQDSGDGVNKIFGLPYKVQKEIEMASKDKADQIMGKDYDDYIGNTPTELSSLEVWGLSEEANAPWTMISDYDEKYNIKSPGHAIGKFGLVGAGVEGAYSTAQDIRKYSGQDRMWAMGIDGVGGVTGILIGGLLVPTGPVGAGISLGVNYGTNIGTSWLKEYYLETDTEKKHKRAMYEFLNGGYREKY